MADDATDTVDFINSMKNVNTVRKTTGDLNFFKKWMEKNNELRNLEEIPWN